MVKANIEKNYDIHRKGWLLGVTKDSEYIYMSKFSWDCGWYWGGGYLHLHRRNNRSWSSHLHFDSIFFDGKASYLGGEDNMHNINVVRKCLKKSALTEDEWWRLMDLMKQFYTLRECAEVFQYGGHYTSKGRTEQELNKEIADRLNDQIKNVIIPEVTKLLSGVGEG